MFQDSFRAGVFRGLRSRHPLARLVVGIIGLLTLALLVALGMFAFAALVIGGGLFLLVGTLRRPRTIRAQANAAMNATPTPAGVIEGEFTVVPSTPVNADVRRER
ncbi:MAG: hypothetical protein ABJB02_01135 [Dokdonella sp.]